MSFADQVRSKLKELEEPRFDPALSGAHLRQPAKMSPGYNLFDGHLIDAKGQVIKKWGARYLGLLLPDGRYLAQKAYESRVWGLYTWKDKIIWEQDFPVHHDIVLTPGQTIVTLTKDMHVYKGRDVDFCAIVEFDLEGRELSRFSTWEHLASFQKCHAMLELDRPKMFFWPEPPARKSRSPWGGLYDYYRLNSFQLLPKTDLGLRDKRFREGNWLISFRHGSMIFILDQESKEIVWKCIAKDMAGHLEGQHAPTMLPNGRMLIFDNGRYRGWSRVLELDPVSLKIEWQYKAPGFYTLSQGYVQKLSNGNVLVTESERGRAFEISPEKEIVWEYYHPEIQDSSNSMHPESYGRRQWIYRMKRYEPSFIEKLPSQPPGL